jgi:glycosyltransferase involved in cell wall biosynthesis
MFSPEFIVPDPPHYDSFCQAVDETDVVMSVSECTKHQFAEEYGYEGPVEVVRYHNLPFFKDPVPLPDGPPWCIGYMGRLNIEQKNLDALLKAFALLCEDGLDVELNFYGDGNDQGKLAELSGAIGINSSVEFHGRYDHRTDLPDIMAQNHIFTYISNYEGGPCFTLLELLQAGRYVVASPVGGIPDIYAGHPEAGLLVDDSDTLEIAVTLRKALRNVKEGRVDPEAIRSRYIGEFDIEAAHSQWCQAISDHSAMR